jgi:GH3 auxin-responsive promoter.
MANTIVNILGSKIIKSRIPQIEYFMQNPLQVQEDVLTHLLSAARNTIWGKFYDYASIQNWDTFNQRVPLNDYNSLLPFFDRIRQSEDNVLWCSEIKWFSKSSGTTNTKSKFIPVSEESLEECHYKGGKDMLALYVNNHPDSNVFSGPSLALGGSQQENEYDNDIFVGDISAIIIDNLPYWAEFFRTPKKEIALMQNWEDKLQIMTKIVATENVVSLSGVPSWMLVLLHKVTEQTGKTIAELWPGLEVYFHGGVSFEPYRRQFEALVGQINYMETYNASEGFFGLQDRTDLESMLLLLDYGIYYEFIPVNELDNPQKHIINLSQVQVGKNYAMVISTNGGLWRYMLGDTIMFTETSPYRFKITGRTKNFINLCGEELIVDNADKAIAKACLQTGGVVNEYTAAPFMQNERYHEWIIEFETPPQDKDKFVLLLDQALQEVNSDYEAKRFKDMVLKAPKVHFAPKGTFYTWLKERGKLGGQHKVPRLANTRDYLDQILKIIAK